MLQLLQRARVGDFPVLALWDALCSHLSKNPCAQQLLDITTVSAILGVSQGKHSPPSSADFSPHWPRNLCAVKMPPEFYPSVYILCPVESHEPGHDALA